MATQSVQSLVEDIRVVSETNHQIVEAVRALVKKTVTSASEEVKYGGIAGRDQTFVLPHTMLQHSITLAQEPA